MNNNKWLVKLLSYAFMGVAVHIISCSDARIEELKKENEALKYEKTARDSIMEYLIRSFSVVDSNMKQISLNENRIQKKITAKADSKVNTDSVLYYIHKIDELADSNKAVVKKLEKKFGADNQNIIGIKQLIGSLNDKNQFKDNELDELKARLATINEDFRKLFEEFVHAEVQQMELNEYKNELERKNQELISQLNIAYYKVGTIDQLKAEGLVDSKGFLFESNNLNQNFNKSLFTKIDIRNLTLIPLNVKKASLISKHPDGSFEFIGNKKKIEQMLIKEPKDFWSVSRYLLIEVEK